MNLHYTLKASNSSSLSDCIYSKKVFSSDWCEDLITYFENSLHYRTDDHRKQADQM